MRREALKSATPDELGLSRQRPPQFPLHPYTRSEVLGSRNRPLSSLIPGWVAQSAVVRRLALTVAPHGGRRRAYPQPPVPLLSRRLPLRLQPRGVCGRLGGFFPVGVER